MMVITLTPQERQRFVAWLDQEVTTNEKLIEQLSGFNQKHSTRRLRQENAASITVATKLRSIKEMD